jgi:hypothetical protein
MESMGLVIIVIILVLAGSFAVFLMSSKKDTGILDEYSSLLANNLRETVLKTELKGCVGVTVQEDIDACDESGGRGGSKCYTRECSLNLQREIKQIIDGSVSKNVGYMFSVFPSGCDEGEECRELVRVARGEAGEGVASASQRLVSGVEIKLILSSI